MPLAAEGLANARIREVVGASVPTLLDVASRYLHDELDGLLMLKGPVAPAISITQKSQKKTTEGISKKAKPRTH